MNNPGWVDLQVNGNAGVDFSDPNLSADEFLRAAEALLNSGTAIFLPTICTAVPEIYRRNPAIIRDAVRSHGLEKQIPGLHYEGPFISPKPGAVGAHNPEWTQIPEPEAVLNIIDEAEGFLRIITIGADAPHAVDGIRAARSRGVVVSIGHHLADYEQVCQAAAAGAKLLTHLGNGIPNLLDRHVNPVWAGLAEERLAAMLITDGHHLPGELIKVIIGCKGVAKIIVTSDASRLTGLPPGRYDAMGNDSVLEPNGRLYCPARKCLVGSASTLAMCMKFLDSLDFLSESELKAIGRDNPMKYIEGL